VRKSLYLLILAATLASAAPASAQDQKEDAAVLFFNGLQWNELSQIDEQAATTVKMFLVRGIYEGAFVMDPERALSQFYPNVSYEDLIFALDKFYREFRNLKTPVSYALVMISRDLEKQNQPKPRRLVSFESPS